ncbi:peroxisomal ATPase PEX6 isoform X3 [Magnolia sinica]|uniref:peroxisomal ATPase PEX6 isoform X3 n=1 Tax=Magnolia sinica TaxID=86752 RepID=UPI0026591C7C|nr:peroxisomal ATPase PEX6 isoform X3 [Magnolia sinica]
MVERRKPLILSSTKTLLHSVLNPSPTERSPPSDHSNPSSSLRLTAGILRRSGDSISGIGLKEASLDNSAFIGVSALVLKRLSVASGSLVLVKNVETNLGRIGTVIVLDPPDTTLRGCTNETKLPSQSQRVMAILPSYAFPRTDHLTLDREVAYLSPVLAFNLGLHVSCWKLLVHGGQESLKLLFEGKESESDENGIKGSAVHVELLPRSLSPRFASHLRVSFVKIPECGTLESLRGSSLIEAEDRQEMIDSALHDYFKVDRYLARGDIFCIQINWNCNSEMCIPCSKKTHKNITGITIHFKVIAMEPLIEPFLRVNCKQTALVLGGSVASALPPDSLIGDSKVRMPLQGDVVKSLASVLTPPLCPSVLSSKFRVAVLLHGLAGCGKRTVVQYVACCLGLHVVEYSCYDLMTSSERKTSVALENAFNTANRISRQIIGGGRELRGLYCSEPCVGIAGLSARAPLLQWHARYSPSIILLRHFELFANLSSNEGSPSDQAGIMSEVASVIREFTEPVPECRDYYSEENANVGSYLVEAERMSRHRILLVAAADSSEGLPPSIRRCFSHEISMGPLSEAQRLEMLSQLLKPVSKVPTHIDIEDVLKDITGQMSGFMPRDIQALVADAAANSVPRPSNKIDNAEARDNNRNHAVGSKPIQDTSSCQNAAHSLGKEDFAKALERLKKRNASALGTPKVPNVKWEDVGGLEDVKKSILDTVQLPLLHKDLFSSGLRKRSGVLLYGPPGTGKTLLAKAVATECSLNFLSVKGPELINMYIGESEKNVRDIFQKARSARPCVIFFDELDSLAPARGASGDSGGVMDRVVSQMLAEIDGLNESTQDLFIIGASNRPDLIDPALLRPGRFDKLLYVGVNSDATYRERVLAALTRKFKLHDNVSLFSIAKRCPPNFTGADMYALCADAWFHSAKRKASFHQSEASCPDGEVDSVVVELDDFMKVLAELSPSLSMAELQKYERLRDQFEGAF